MSRYVALIEKTGTGYSAHVPDLPGCIAAAESDIEGWFDLAKLPKNNKEKKPFASFDVSESGTVYRCQLHLWELPFPPEKTTTWDNRRGASAGIPSLGKRR